MRLWSKNDQTARFRRDCFRLHCFWCERSIRLFTFHSSRFHYQLLSARSTSTCTQTHTEEQKLVHNTDLHPVSFCGSRRQPIRTAGASTESGMLSHEAQEGARVIVGTQKTARSFHFMLCSSLSPLLVYSLWSAKRPADLCFWLTLISRQTSCYPHWLLHCFPRYASKFSLLWGKFFSYFYPNVQTSFDTFLAVLFNLTISYHCWQMHLFLFYRMLKCQHARLIIY